MNPSCNECKKAARIIPGLVMHMIHAGSLHDEGCQRGKRQGCPCVYPNGGRKLTYRKYQGFKEAARRWLQTSLREPKP